MTLLKLKRFALSVIVVATGTVALATSLTPASYIDIELRIRQLTVDGMEQRHFLLKLQNKDSVEDQQDLDAETVSVVDDVFRDYGTNAGKHAAYGTQNVEAIEKYLIDNPTIKQQLESIDVEFERLSSLISAELGNN